MFTSRYNLAVSEDLTQLCPGYTLFSKPLRVDCEDYAQHAIKVAKAINKLKVDFATQSNITLDEAMHPRLFGFMETSDRVMHVKAINHILSQVKSVECHVKTGNAHGGQASTTTGAAGNSDLTGHAFAGSRFIFEIPSGVAITDPFIQPQHICKDDPSHTTIILHSIVEGTKWVVPMHDKVCTRLSRNASLELPVLQAVNQITSLLMEATKLASVVPTSDKGSAELQILENRGPGFYANVYVSGDHMVFHESIPGVKTAPLVLGAPLSYSIFNVSTLHPMPVQFTLATQHLRAAGCTNIGDNEIKDMVLGMALEEAMPTWRMQEWTSNVFSQYLPCKTLYENPAVTQAFVPGKHCCFSFTHQAVNGMNMDVAKQYANNILEIVHQGKLPPITYVHATRLKTAGLPPNMPEQFLNQIPSFNPDEMNAHLSGLFKPQGKQAVHVESISTVMGCVLTTCIAEVEHLPKIVNGLISWAKPIIQAGAQKQAACMAWRRQLESQFAVMLQQQQLPPGFVMQHTGAEMAVNGPENNGTEKPNQHGPGNEPEKKGSIALTEKKTDGP